MIHLKSNLPNDTHPAMERKMIELLRQMSPAQKIQRVQSLNETLELLALADVRKRHPEADERECFLRVASRRLPPDLMRKAYGWDPELTNDRYDKENELEEQLRQVQINDFELRKLMQFAEAQRETR